MHKNPEPGGRGKGERLGMLIQQKNQPGENKGENPKGEIFDNKQEPVSHAFFLPPKIKNIIGLMIRYPTGNTFLFPLLQAATTWPGYLSRNN
jgi:hypothetical protein